MMIDAETIYVRIGQGEACDDCVYYGAYGTLDDQTMIEVRKSEEE